MKYHPLKVLWLLMLIAAPLRAETYRVGPQRDIKSLKAVVGRLQPGDVVEVDPSTYREAMKITAQGTPEAPIVIRGVGAERPLFDGEGMDLSGAGAVPRGLLQIEGAYIVVEHLAFKNARNAQNAAGIRLLESTNAVIRDCYITYCDMGVFGSDRETVTIENSEVAYNGTDKHNGGSHNFYMHGNRVLVRGCYIHNSLFGQNYKTRAHYNELLNNWIADSAEGEVGPVDSAETATPNSNMLIAGNVIVSSPQRTGNTAKFILFGSEMGGSRDGTLYLFHNTLIAGDNRIHFVTTADSKARFVMSHNVFMGSSNLLSTPQKPLSVTGRHNWIEKNAVAPAGWQSTLTGDAIGFVDAAQRNFHLSADSPLLKVEASDLFYVDGDGFTRRLIWDSAGAPRPQIEPHAGSVATIGALGRE